MTDHESLNAVLRELAVLTSDTASEAFAEWKVAILEHRFSTDGKSGISKLRIVKTDESIDSSKSPPIETLNLWEQLWALRDRTLANSWYGIKLTVDTLGKTTVDFGHDEKGIDDESFFES
jgi:hypothetical protein